MAYDLEEQEQLDALKAWWKQNRAMVFIVLGVFVATAVGMKAWRWYQHDQGTKAAILYETVQEAAQTGDLKRTRDAAGQLIERHPRTAYAPKAALLAARVNYQNNDATSAKAQLKWAIEHADSAEVKDLARLRLAAVLLDEKAYDEALKLVESPEQASFAGLYADLRGDALAAKGKPAEAKAAYTAALEKTEAKSPYRKLIEMKLEALGT